jgi:hypothetical protein
MPLDPSRTAKTEVYLANMRVTNGIEFPLGWQSLLLPLSS